MADLSDIEDALADIIAAPFYPGGAFNADNTVKPPIDAISSLGCPMVKIYPGWPNSDQLDKDVRLKKVNVSIFGAKTEKNVTKYVREWQELSRNDPTVAAVIAGDTLTLSGSISVPQLIAATVFGNVYSYALQESDTLSSAAEGLAALIAVDTPAAATGPVVTANGLTKAHIGVEGVLAREVRRTQKQFMVSIWAPNDDLRVAVARVLDPVVSTLDQVALADGSKAIVTYVSSQDNDDPQEGLIYRRDVIFLVEYPTLETIKAMELVAGELAYSAAQRSDVVTPPLEITTDNVEPVAPGWPGAEW